MLDAKNKFREGFIMTKRPFKFANMKNPIQAFTIMWAYSEQPQIRPELTQTAREKLEEIEFATNPHGFFSKTQREEWMENEMKKIIENPKSYDQIYLGDVVQTYIDGELIRLYPDEYTIVDADKLAEIMEEEGYHAVCTRGLLDVADFRDKTHYLQSRGVPAHIANKWASMSYKELVYYKPYYELLTMFCRDHEIYADEFYDRIEGIPMKEQIQMEKEALQAFSERPYPNNFLHR